ncbi:MAG: hypothetical protein CMH49_09080 [Myxococcales bacterium]|nr:hypothetical protein [Myxococcales bacterium]
MTIALKIAFELENYIYNLTAGFIVLLLVMYTLSDENGDRHNQKSHVPHWKSFLAELEACFFYFCPADKLLRKVLVYWAAPTGLEKKLDKLCEMTR